MGRVSKEEAVKYVAGVLYPSDKLFDSVLSLFSSILGDVDFKSREVDFKFTDYYEKEMGRGLKRCFVSFEKRLKPSLLAEVKLKTNDVELRLSADGKRKVNIDPGYLDLSKLVVASTKDATYRICLNNGVFAQGMLYYEHGSFKPWRWAYQDYREGFSIAFFNKVREIYKEQLASGKN